MTELLGYYYLHQNSELIFRHPLSGILQDFRESDLVIKWWPVYENDLEQAELILDEAKALGARIERIEELAGKWGITMQ